MIYNEAVSLFNNVKAFKEKELCSYDTPESKILLRYLGILFEPKNYRYYAYFDEKGQINQCTKPEHIPEDMRPVPDYLPQGWEKLCEYCVGPTFAKIRPKRDLGPGMLQEATEHLSSLTLDECANYLMYCSRAGLHYGQQFYFKSWRDGVSLAVVERMLELSDNHKSHAPEHTAYVTSRQSEVQKMSSIKIEQTSITKLYVDAVVNAANTGLLKGGGVCGAIFKEAGSAELTAACSQYGHCGVGNAVITPGFHLKAKYIIHAVGPRWIDGQHGEPSQLYDAYKSALYLAKENGCHSIGFPLISAGIFGYPKGQAWRKAIQSCADFISDNPDYNITINFAVLDSQIRAMGEEILKEMTEEKYTERLAACDQYAKDYFKRHLLLLKALYEDETLRTWCQQDECVPNAHPELTKILEEFYREFFNSPLNTFRREDCCALLTEHAVQSLENMQCGKTESLSKLQLLAAISTQYLAASRWAHWDEHTWPFLWFVGHGSLIPYFEAYLKTE